MLDLTPFGFTPTESHAYGALIELGPSSAYAVARALSVARANAYQALDGLVAKGAAVLATEEAPRRYRAIQPQTVFARIVDNETRKLDALERQVLEQPRQGADPVTTVRGARALNDLVVRALIRAETGVRLLATSDRLGGWAPAIRARAAAGRSLELWSADGRAADLVVEPRTAPAERVRDVLGEDPVLLIADGALIATMGPGAEGVWSDARVIVGLVDSALRHLTQGEETNQTDG